MSDRPRVVVVGAGIVGAACAEALSRDGCEVLVVDAGATGGGATAAGMGHVLLLDDSSPQFALTDRSRSLWDARANEWPDTVDRSVCGTLWLAEDDVDMEAARQKAARLAERGIAAELIEGDAALRRLEPALAEGLYGALRITDDSVIYAPAATDHFLRAVRQSSGGEILRGRTVRHIDTDGTVTFTDGERLEADLTVVSAGHQGPGLLDESLRASCPQLRIEPKKGHLAITERLERPLLQHQIVELGYLRSAHSNVAEAVALNVQPRPTGQLLIGSSRQLGRGDDAVEPRMIAGVLERAQRFLPSVAHIRVLRCWAGLRPATPDHLPWIGPLPGSNRVWFASGHEGWGMTAATGTGELVADLVAGRPPKLDPRPFDPARAAAEACPASTATTD